MEDRYRWSWSLSEHQKSYWWWWWWVGTTRWPSDHSRAVRHRQCSCSPLLNFWTGREAAYSLLITSIGRCHFYGDYINTAVAKIIGWLRRYQWDTAKVTVEPDKVFDTSLIIGKCLRSQQRWIQADATAFDVELTANLAKQGYIADSTHIIRDGQDVLVEWRRNNHSAWARFGAWRIFGAIRWTERFQKPAKWLFSLKHTAELWFLCHDRCGIPYRVWCRRSDSDFRNMNPIRGRDWARKTST